MYLFSCPFLTISFFRSFVRSFFLSFVLSFFLTFLFSSVYVFIFICFFTKHIYTCFHSTESSKANVESFIELPQSGYRIESLF